MHTKCLLACQVGIGVAAKRKMQRSGVQLGACAGGEGNSDCKQEEMFHAGGPVAANVCKYTWSWVCQPEIDGNAAIYHSQIVVEHIPAAAYEYVVNGKSAIEWVLERYQVTTHQDSGIRNDPNDWAAESGNPRYILDLLLSVIRLSVETAEVVQGLPEFLTFAPK